MSPFDSVKAENRMITLSFSKPSQMVESSVVVVPKVSEAIDDNLGFDGHQLTKVVLRGQKET